MSPNAKLKMQNFLTQCTNSLFFPNSHPTTLTPLVTSSLSHTLPDSRLHPIVPSLSHTLPNSLPPFPFPQQIKKSLSLDLERSWRNEGKNWSPIPSFFFPCLMVVIRDKKWYGYAVNLCLSSGYSTIKWFASGYFFGGGVVLHCC